MSEQGGPNGPTGQGHPGQGWPQGGPTGPQGWQQPHTPPPGGPGATPWQGQPAGPQGWQQPAPTQQFGPGQQHPAGQQYPAAQQYPAGQQHGQPGPTPPPAKNRTPILITAIAVVVALVAAAAVYLFAVRDSDTSTASGAQTPQESVSALFTTLSNSDPIGLADRLDPAEASLFTDLNTDVITELKRLEVLSPAASADTMTGTTITVQGLTYDGAPEAINENLQIVKLTGGTVTVASDPNNIPLSDKIKDAFGSEIDQAQPQSQTVNIAEAVAENDGKPFRVATVRRDGEWYVSLFYTIADNAVHEAGLPNPTDADRIDPAGAESAEAAVNTLIEKATTGELEGVIALMPPDEMGALHDYGKLVIQQADADGVSSDMTDVGVKVDGVTWISSEVTGGTKLSLQSMNLTANGQTVTFTRDVEAGSVTLKIPGQSDVKLDESTIESYLGDALGSGDLDPQLLEIMKREFKQIIGLGVVTVQVDGKWYVSPIRSVSDVFLSLLKGLEPGDVDYLISLSGN